jgi:hypothetical protein
MVDEKLVVEDRIVRLVLFAGVFGEFDHVGVTFVRKQIGRKASKTGLVSVVS